MNSMLEDHVISYKENHEGHDSCSNQMDIIRDEKVHFGVNADSGSIRHKHEAFSDMLLWLKSVAIDHNKANNSSSISQKSWSRILKARKVLSLSNEEAPWRKRKLNLLLQETKYDSAPRSKKPKPNGRSSTKRRKYSNTSYSCLNRSADSEGSSDQIQHTHYSVRSLKYADSLYQRGIPNSSCQFDALRKCSPDDTEFLPVLDSDDSVSGSNLSCSAKLLVQSSQHRPIKLLKSGYNDPRKQVRISPYPGGYVKGTSSPSSKKAKKLKSSQMVDKPFDFVSDYIPRMAIPVGPRFQAAIPDLIEDSSAGANAYLKSSEKWLGTRVWPIEGTNAETSKEVIGRGRPRSCSCNLPGSPQCIKLHVNEKRLQLKSDLSSAFYSWKFDEMGEEVSKLWKPVEEKSFMILVKMNPVSKNLSFWQPAVKWFPSKPREHIVSYYFNVFVLRRMSRQTRLAAEVDSDDDEEVYEGVGQSKDAKQRYLTGLR